MLYKNMICRLHITDLNNLGFGVARQEGLVVFVADAVDGDVVDARILRVNRTYAVAKVEALLIPSPHRIENDCEAASCGGCAYRHISYEHELAIKREYVRSAFHKCGMPDVQVGQVLHTCITDHYRNKAQYPVSLDKDGHYHIGFYAPRSHRVVEAAACPLQPPAFAAVLEDIRAFLQQHRTGVYDETTGEGLLRHICLRQGGEGELLLILVLNGSTLPHSDELVETLTARHPALAGILINENTADTNVIYGERFTTLWGRDYLEDTLCGLRLRLTAPAFYQVNRAAAELLYRKAAELAELRGDELLLDLFCGIGSIGLSMADRVREVVGIELEPSAVACATENARRNGIRHARFFCGDATHTGRLLSEAEASLGRPLRPDVVVLDPPRKGCSPELLAFLQTLAPQKILYISCNPDTLARDIATLAQPPAPGSAASGSAAPGSAAPAPDSTPLVSTKFATYTPGPVTPVDLFPRTGHVETVVLITRAKE
ncbi:MAG: 23S rRNA (uracil(1939)-C(5))-methyltransferase RlmD [Eubacteriales bacterium]